MATHKVKAKKKNWIKGAIKHPGSFGKATPKKIAAGIKKGGKAEKKAVLARTLKKLAKKRAARKRG